MRIISAVISTFKNIDRLSAAFIYIGLELTAGLIAVTLVLTLLQGHYGDYVDMISKAHGMLDAALSCGFISVFAAFICDAAAKDKGIK